MLKAGSLINGKYSIISSIRCDDFSTTYLALDERLSTTWQIKVIPKFVQLGNAHIRQSLTPDPHHLMRLDHPHLQRIIDIIEDEDSYILIMDAIEGLPLDSVLENMGPQPESLVIPWALQLCDILQYMHTITPRIFCGHIKTSQILLKPDGNIVLIDFFTTNETVSPKHDTVCLGTPFNIAPELSSIDERTDIFYFGSTIFSILNGTNPHATHYELFQDIADNTTLSKDIKYIISKCIQLNPDNRFQTAAELSYALQNNQSCSCRKRSKAKAWLESIKATKSSKKTKKHSYLSVKDVQFSVIAPKRFLRGEYTIIDIFMHEDDYKNVVLSSKLNDLFSSTTSGYLRVEDGTSVSVQLISSDIIVEDDIETLTWQGKYLRFQFMVYLPENYDKEQLRFTATVYFNSVIACKLSVISTSISAKKQSLLVNRTDYQSAFISYASQDRNRVLSIVQGMRKMRPDMHIFLDIDGLRSGDRWENIIKNEIIQRDVLFLCWSQFAKNSAWVDMEWRYALDNKGIDAIEPIPLEPSSKCPPPQELASKHFNDRELFYMDNEL